MRFSGALFTRNPALMRKEPCGIRCARPRAPSVAPPRNGVGALHQSENWRHSEPQTGSAALDVDREWTPAVRRHGAVQAGVVGDSLAVDRDDDVAGANPCASRRRVGDHLFYPSAGAERLRWRRRGRQKVSPSRTLGEGGGDCREAQRQAKRRRSARSSSWPVPCGRPTFASSPAFPTYVMYFPYGVG